MEKTYKVIAIVGALLFWVMSAQLVVAQSQAVKAAQNYYEDNGADILNHYKEYLRIPNVASDIPNIRRSAQYLVKEFEKRGAEMELLELPDRKDVPPVVYGEITVPNAERTLILYVHYDGQPVDTTNWTHHPWTPKLYSKSMEEGGEPIAFPHSNEQVDPDWRIYARSASDDKAPIPALLAALDALKTSDIGLTSNIKFFFDGEEEAGSPHIRQYLERYKSKFDDGDLWVFLDGPKHQSGRPQVVFGVRGVTGMEITVYGTRRPLHSGHYGGWAPVAGQMMVELLSSMKKETGEVLIDGYYESTAPITEADRKAFATLPDYDDQIRKDLGITWSEFGGQSLIERYMYPTLTIKGIKSGNVGKKARNVIPKKATASLGMRLAKGNNPEAMQELVEAHIRKQGYHIVREEPDMERRLNHKKIAKVTRGKGYSATRTSVDNPMAKQIVSAVADASDEEVILYPTYGGTLPLYHFTEVLEQPLIIVPIANHDNNQHAPDENIRIGNIWYGIETYSSILTMD
ncbi:M20/M25/M40 family metallo-hydrolase [Fodinibius halophilus]|uniref:M20/M25/M40 family metallo-hydrolase n=1 Tax=Fodinibius halophilus TaxID=1736908 RepID=A0A6M1TCF1_9BACT|nr:M20/M25/M40 family metallo-hydrolase [Fodinibius halophilus]NGP90043.1 M20/M25/M40 family metallo-hydrolase [Fodinibius halophilus]